MASLLPVRYTKALGSVILAVLSLGAIAAETVQQEVVMLPKPRYESDVSLEQVLRARRSHREFLPSALSLGQVGQLLWAAQGVSSPEGGRTAPSAGALYPLETYLVAGKVESLAAGVYRYDPAHHGLQPVASGDRRAALAAAALGQEWVASPPAVLVLTAVYRRTMVKYGERGIRYVHMEAGHAAQNVALQATALGLGVVTVGAFSDADVKAVLGLDGSEEPLYLLPVGWPAGQGSL